MFDAAAIRKELLLNNNDRVQWHLCFWLMKMPVQISSTSSTKRALSGRGVFFGGFIDSFLLKESLPEWIRLVCISKYMNDIGCTMQSSYFGRKQSYYSSHVVFEISNFFQEDIDSIQIKITSALSFHNIWTLSARAAPVLEFMPDQIPRRIDYLYMQPTQHF